MIKIIAGYKPKNKKLARLGRKARLQLVLNGSISSKMLAEVREVISCGNCKYYNEKGIVMNSPISACRKVGEKTKKYLMMMDSMTKDGQPRIGLQIAYCCQFEEKK